jgi:hypothetical protein
MGHITEISVGQEPLQIMILLPVTVFWWGLKDMKIRSGNFNPTKAITISTRGSIALKPQIPVL